ncbi:MAG TPA: hypothetical protein VE733_10660, partial [Streptosporangiaceae bacterium]|nr:hypothetical protein [Streptosporangiaceae bacterium]
MNASQPRRVDRRTAEQLLSGDLAGPDAGHARLSRLLAAASAPGRDSELAGEEMAVAAFTAERPVPVAKSREGQMIKSPLAKLLTLKVLGVAAACGSIGGVALAANAGAFSSTPATSVTSSGQSSASVSDGTASATMGGGAHSSGQLGKFAQLTVNGKLTSSAVTELSGLCTQVADKVAVLKGEINSAGGQALSPVGIEQALASPAVAGVLSNPTFASLTSLIGNATDAPNYCALLLDLPKLPDPAILSQLPTAALTTLPVSVLGKLPTSVLADLPTSVLSGLP